MQQHLWFSGEDHRDWRLDEHTKMVGREGVRAARAVLAACQAEAVTPIASAA